MRTHLEFVSAEFPAYPGEEEEVNPGRFGKRLAEFLSSELPSHGFSVTNIGAEDWGVMVQIENQDFPLWVGCGNYEEFENGFLCFIEPSTPYVRKWLKKIPTEHTVLENKARGSKSQEREVFHAPQKAQGRAGSRRVQGFICIRREPARHAEQAVESSARESK